MCFLCSAVLLICDSCYSEHWPFVSLLSLLILLMSSFLLCFLLYVSFMNVIENLYFGSLNTFSVSLIFLAGLPPIEYRMYRYTYVPGQADCHILDVIIRVLGTECVKMMFTSMTQPWRSITARSIYNLIEIRKKECSIPWDQLCVSIWPSRIYCQSIKLKRGCIESFNLVDVQW